MKPQKKKPTLQDLRRLLKELEWWVKFYNLNYAEGGKNNAICKQNST